MKTYGTVQRGPLGWIISAEPHVLIKMKRLFTKIDRGQFGYVTLSPTTENAADLYWFMKRYPLEGPPADLATLEKASQEFFQEQEMISDLFAGRLTPRKFELALPLREYQAIASEAMLRAQSLLLGDDLGVGKTATAIGMLTDPDTRPALIVTVTHLPMQWKAELGRFLPGVTSHILTSTRPYQLPLMKRPGSSRPEKPDVVITSYSKLAGWGEALAGKVKAVVFDEGQELRHSGSDKYRAATYIARKAKYRVALTATPVYNYGAEFFNLAEVLRPSAFGTWEEFIREWCETQHDKNGKAKLCIKNPRSFGLHARDIGFMLRRTRKDVGREMPRCSRIIHEVDADLTALDKIKGKATELAKIILTQTGLDRGEKMRAAEEFTMKLRQATGIAKAPFVAEFARMVVEGGEPLVLFGWHHAVYEIWGERLKDLRPVFYTGRETPTAKAAAARDFIAGKSDLLIMSLRSGTGLDGLQHRTRTGAFGELDWSPQVHDQDIGRWDRDGQKDPTSAYFLVSAHGADPIMSDVLGLKRAQSEGIINPKNEDAPDFAQVDPQSIKRLAAAYLAKLGIAAPAAPPPGHQSALAIAPAPRPPQQTSLLDALFA